MYFVRTPRHLKLGSFLGVYLLDGFMKMCDGREILTPFKSRSGNLEDLREIT
jgi:hypothetical protein